MFLAHSSNRAQDDPGYKGPNESFFPFARQMTKGQTSQLMPSSNPLGRTNRDSQYDRKTSTATFLYPPSPSLKYLIHEVYVDLLDTLWVVFRSYNVPSSLDKPIPIALLLVNSDRQNIIGTSFSVGVNSLKEVINLCVSMLQREISKSKSAWLLVTSMDMEMSKAFLTLIC